MKRLIAACVALCVGFAVFGAEAVDYSIPVLTVKVDGEKVVPGSGKTSRCPFSFVATTNATPVRVSIMEDMPSGAGNSLRASLWLATTTASLTLNRTLSGTTVNFETSGYVDGPSAGGVLCLAVMSAIDGRAFPADFAMTGTIMADGTVGAVGGVAEKIRAASKAGIKRICIPASVRMDEDFTDLLDLGQSLNVEMHQVATIADAYRVLHRLPAQKRAQLSPVDICCLLPQVEGALKNQFASFVSELPDDASLQNQKMHKAVEEYRAGMFGAADMDMLEGLDQYSFDCISLYLEDVKPYPPALEHELPTNGVSILDKIAGTIPSKDQYVDALRAFHRDINNLGTPTDDDAESGEEVECGNRQASSGDVNKFDEWSDDGAESPIGAQFITLANYNVAKAHIWAMACNDIATAIGPIDGWDELSAAQLNEIRSLLFLKLDYLSRQKTFDVGVGNCDRLMALHQGLSESIPYVRPNTNVQRVENIFYRTMMAMDEALKDSGLTDDRVARGYRVVLDLAIEKHGGAAQEDEKLLAVFSEAQALAAACALVMQRAMNPTGQGVGNSTFFSSAVSTARENALINISECRTLGIPCVMPIINFQIAESLREDYSSGDADATRRSVLECYLHASLAAKALVLCFDGQKPELNEKGYCCKWVTSDSNPDARTVRYLGVDGKPILRDGFGGYRFIRKNDGAVYTTWLDLDGRDVRIKTANELYTVEYDAVGRWHRMTYCNASWIPSPRADGVLFETFGYDADGNKTSWEFFDVASNRVTCADGMAVIKMRHNKRGQEMWRRYYGVKGEPVVNDVGCAGFDIVYDRNGNERKRTFVNEVGNPVNITSGYARIERKYDVQNRETECAWHDMQGKLVAVDGVAKICNEYDDRGNLTVRAYYGADGQSVRGCQNYAIARWSYNAFGEAASCRYYGPDGNPTLHRDGNASWETVFDAAGRNLGRKYYDLNGKEIDMDERKDDKK